MEILLYASCFFFLSPKSPVLQSTQSMETSTGRDINPPDVHARLERAAAGDQAAWAAILAPHRERLRRMIAPRWTTGSKGEAIR
jgi:hypothetical protein